MTASTVLLEWERLSPRPLHKEEPCGLVVPELPAGSKTSVNRRDRQKRISECRLPTSKQATPSPGRSGPGLCAIPTMSLGSGSSSSSLVLVLFLLLLLLGAGRAWDGDNVTTDRAAECLQQRAIVASQIAGA